MHGENQVIEQEATVPFSYRGHFFTELLAKEKVWPLVTEKIKQSSLLTPSACSQQD